LPRSSHTTLLESASSIHAFAGQAWSRTWFPWRVATVALRGPQRLDQIAAVREAGDADRAAL
jgi:hypothetical protein